MTRPWETVRSEKVLDGAPWLVVWREAVRLPTGRVLEPFYRYQKGQFSIVFVVTRQGLALIQRRWRHGPRAVTLDCPAGYIEPGEDPMEAAKRELLEETGYAADRWEPLGHHTTDGNSGGSVCHMFLARDAYATDATTFDDAEESELLLMPLDDVEQALDRGDFATLSSGAVIARALLRLRR